MPALARLLLLAAALPATSGCAWLLGHSDVPQPRDPVAPMPAVARTVAGPLALEATWLGPGARIVTARRPWGTADRVVNPYGADTFRVRLVARATGEAAVLLPQRATLSDPLGPPRVARTLPDFRARWPAWAVASDDEDADRRAAYEHVLDTLLVEREVPAGAETTGILAFPAFPAAGRVELRLPYRVGLKGHVATLIWEGG